MKKLFAMFVAVCMLVCCMAPVMAAPTFSENANTKATALDISALPSNLGTNTPVSEDAADANRYVSTINLGNGQKLITRSLDNVTSGTNAANPLFTEKLGSGADSYLSVKSGCYEGDNITTLRTNALGTVWDLGSLYKGTLKLDFQIQLETGTNAASRVYHLSYLPSVFAEDPTLRAETSAAQLNSFGQITGTRTEVQLTTYNPWSGEGETFKNNYVAAAYSAFPRSSGGYQRWADVSIFLDTDTGNYRIYVDGQKFGHSYYANGNSGDTIMVYDFNLGNGGFPNGIRYIDFAGTSVSSGTTNVNYQGTQSRSLYKNIAARLVNTAASTEERAATNIYADNFDSLTTGKAFMTEFEPTTGTTLVGGQPMYISYTTNYDVAAVAVGANGVPTGGNASGNVLKLHQEDTAESWKGGYGAHYLVRHEVLADSTNINSETTAAKAIDGRVVFEYDVCFAARDYYYPINVEFGDVGVKQLMRLVPAAETGDSLLFQLPHNGAYLTGGVCAGEWNHLKVELNQATDQMRIWVNGIRATERGTGIDTWTIDCGTGILYLYLCTGVKLYQGSTTVDRTIYFDNLKYYQVENTLEALQTSFSASDNTLTLTGTFENDLAIDGSYTAVPLIGVYQGGKLVAFGRGDAVTAAKGETKTFTATADLANVSGDYVAKGFIWTDFDDVMPIKEVVKTGAFYYAGTK